MANNRVAWLDIAKGMAIILMVLGHTSIPAVASNFIYAFHMPLFFIALGHPLGQACIAAIYNSSPLHVDASLWYIFCYRADYQ